MKKILIQLLILFFASSSFAQLMKHPLTNYNQKDYGRGQEAQNWSVVQSNSGLMYFGNANGVLEYDGKSWRFIAVKTGTYVTSLDCDQKGNIYVGAQNDFGILAPDKTAKLVYKSLADSTDKKNFSFSTVWKTFVIGSKVFFQSEEMLFVYDNGKLEKIKPETSFHLSFKVNNQLWIKQRKKGLMKYDSGKLIPIKNGGYFKDIGICGITILQNNPSELLITTFDQGFYLYNSNTGETKTITLSDSKQFSSVNLYGSLKLNDGYTAINSTNKGLFIINPQGKIEGMVNEESGLQVNDIKQVYQDKQNNLWLAMNNGIAKVIYTSPLSFYSQKSGLSGNVYSVCSYHDQLFVGTSTGLYKQKQGSLFYTFERVTEIGNMVWGLAEIDNNLIVASADGLFVFNNGKVKNYSKLDCRSLYVDETNKLLFVSGYYGLAIFKLNPLPKFLKFVNDLPPTIVSIVKSPKSKSHIQLWLGSAYQGIIRVDFDKELTSTSEAFNDLDGLPKGSVLPFVNNDKVVFASNNGLLSFVSEETILSLLPPAKQKDAKKIKGYFESTTLKDSFNQKAVTCMLSDADRSFVVYDNILNYAKNKNSGYNNRTFAGIEFGKINSLFSWHNVLWMGADEGLIGYQINSEKSFACNWNVLIRKISVNDSALYFGVNNLRKHSFNFGKNRISFDFAGLFYDQSEKITYSYKLENFDDKWSNWSSNSSVTFTSLREANYVLKVKAKNIYGLVSNEESIAFVILPPWYRTIYAYIGYLIAFALFVWLLIVLSTMGLKRKNDYLEKIVEKRTLEISLEKDKSEKLLLNTLPAKVVSDLKLYGKTEPENFPEVTAYFSDVCGFTDMTSVLEPKLVISELSEIFTAFDDIMVRNHCERIKTIGDAYLAVCGMPEQNDNHAENMIKSAIEILSYLKERNSTHELKWRIRIGINSGKVVGGIVGVRKYIYDVFGDTINTASRMESNSEPMRINVAEATYSILKDKYQFTTREPKEVKGKGLMNMYFLEI